MGTGRGRMGVRGVGRMVSGRVGLLLLLLSRLLLLLGLLLVLARGG